MKKNTTIKMLRKKRRQLIEKHVDRKERIQKDVERYGKEILQSKEMKQAFEQTHHQWSTVGEHTMRVTKSSVWLSYALRKLHVNVNIPDVVVGSLCHDLGILGRDEKYASDRQCCKEHPKDSVKVARKLIDDLPEKTEKIIEEHMWPISGPVPKSIEAVVVSASDKYNSLKDLVKGSEVNQTGIKNLILNEKNKIGGMLHGKR